MSIKVALTHRTRYDFARPVEVGPHVVRLRPAPHCRTPIAAYSLDITPAHHFINWQQDPFGNWLARLVFPEKVTTLEITVGLVADLMVINPVRLLHRGVRRALPVLLRADPRRRPGAVPPPGGGQHRDRVVARGPAATAGRRDAHRHLPRRAQLGGEPRRGLRRPDGAGRPDPRRDAHPPDRLVPRQRLAAGEPAAPVRPGGPVRLRLPRAAGARRLRDRGERRPGRPDQGLHRPARLGGGLHPRRGLGRARPDQRAVRRGGAHPAQRHTAPKQRGADRGRHASRWRSRSSTSTT